MAFTKNFVFTDPVAAQQAVQYAQLANLEQAQADQAFNERFRTATQGSIARDNTSQQRMLSQSQMQQRAAENEKDRELQRAGYTNAQTVAGIMAGRTGVGGTFEQRLKAQQDAEAADLSRLALTNFNNGRDYAEMLNGKGISFGLRQTLEKSGHVTMGPDGIWRNRYPNPNLPAENFQEILQRSMIPSPSQGGTPSRGSLINRNQVVTATSPRIYDMEAPPVSYEAPVDQPWAQPAPSFSVPYSEFLSTDAPPRTRLPGAYLPY